MSDEPKRGQAVDPVRRKLLKASALAGGALAAGVLPYEKPAVKSFFGTPSAWAQATPPLMISFSGEIGSTAPGTVDPNAGQDRWEFEVFYAGTTLTILAESDDGFGDFEIYLYPPGPIALGDDNLLQGSGNPLGLDLGGLGASESAMVTVGAAGVYTFAIEDKRSPGSETTGAYTVTIAGDMTLGLPVQVVDEGPESDAPASG